MKLNMREICLSCVYMGTQLDRASWGCFDANVTQSCSSHAAQALHCSQALRCRPEVGMHTKESSLGAPWEGNNQKPKGWLKYKTSGNAFAFQKDANDHPL